MKLPNQTELQALRKGLRKQMPPKINEGDNGCFPKIGKFKVLIKNSELHIEWQLLNKSDSEIKIANWMDLCKNEDLEMERLELGYLIHKMYKIEAKKVRDSIGHPLTAIQYAAPYEEIADRWMHWAIVPAGFMLKLK